MEVFAALLNKIDSWIWGLPMLVLLCGGIGALGLLCYLLLMGEMVPTGEILRALLRRKQS